jgi:hypothetical protein
MQLGDVFFGETEFLENLVGVLAEVRRPRGDLARRARQFERLADQPKPAAVDRADSCAMPRCLTCGSSNT